MLSTLLPAKNWEIGENLAARFPGPASAGSKLGGNLNVVI
jgi:hypothetical protein